MLQTLIFIPVIKLHVLVIYLMMSGSVYGQDPEEVEVWTFEQLEHYFSKPEDKLRVVNFWATWCAPCIKELPLFESLNAGHKNKVEVLLVSLDFVDNKERKVLPFMQKKNIKSKVIILGIEEYNVWIGKVHDSWSGAIPATLMILPGGERRFYDREFVGSQLEDVVNQLLQ